MAHPIRGWGVYSQHPERLQSFYGELFGWDIETQSMIHGPGPRPEDHAGPYGVVHSHVPGDIHGSIAPSTLAMSFTVDGRPFSGVVVYVYVDDIQAAFDRAQRAGAKVGIPPTPIGDRGFVAMMLDPDENAFFMWQPPPGWHGDEWARTRGVGRKY